MKDRVTKTTTSLRPEGNDITSHVLLASDLRHRTPDLSHPHDLLLGL